MLPHQGYWWAKNSKMRGLPFPSRSIRCKTMVLQICKTMGKMTAKCVLTHRFCRICKTYASHVLSTKKHSTILRFFLNGQAPKYLIRDNDRKFGPSFARVATTSSIKVLRTPYRTPRANAVCERFLGSVRRECLDHFLILHEKQLHRLLKTYVMYYNQARPHQGIRQRIPDPPALAAPPSNQPNQMVSIAVLGGLHHHYQRAA